MSSTYITLGSRTASPRSESKNAIFKFIIFHITSIYYYALFTSISRLNILSDSKFEYTPMSSTLSGE